MRMRGQSSQRSRHGACRADNYRNAALTDCAANGIPADIAMQAARSYQRADAQALSGPATAPHREGVRLENGAQKW